jgi:hypothetical protein
MTDPVAVRLRGSLPLTIDARLIEQSARSGCQRFRASVAAGSDPRRVAEAAFGPDSAAASAGGISPFARAIGVAFERWLLEAHASVFLSIYESSAGWFPDGVEDLRPLLDAKEHDRVMARSIELVEQRLRDGSGPELILGARFPLRTAAGTTHIQPDYLCARPGARTVRVGEIKSYLDLDGRTDGHEIGTAVRQAAVGIVAVRQSVDGAAAQGEVDLVLRVPRRPGASVRPLDATVEVASIETFLASAGDVAATTMELTGSVPLSDPSALEAVPHNFEPACERHCPLYEECHHEAVEADELSLLGPDGASALEGVGTLTRATELAMGATPVAEDEERVAATLRAAWEASERAEESPNR